MTNCGSQGSSVPRPKLREHAHSLSHASVVRKAVLVMGLKVEKRSERTHASTAPRHSSSPYLRTHWSSCAGGGREGSGRGLRGSTGRRSAHLCDDALVARAPDDEALGLPVRRRGAGRDHLGAHEGLGVADLRVQWGGERSSGAARDKGRGGARVRAPHLLARMLAHEHDALAAAVGAREGVASAVAWRRRGRAQEALQWQRRLTPSLLPQEGVRTW